jgi:hypothetical protein
MTFSRLAISNYMNLLKPSDVSAMGMNAGSSDAL